MEISDRYSPQEVEDRIYKQWEKKGHFRSKDQSTQPPFSIILPPPNVTGQLHIGHALNHTLQDVMIRWKRMSGYNTMWLPGSDHAGIATQGVVEKELAKEGLTRREMGREKFEARIWDWKQQYGNRIIEQMKRLGDSCDWDRFVFTLDEDVSKAVRKVFVSMYEKGLIYRGLRLINWSPKLESALSDLEVEHKEVKGTLFHIRYTLVNGKGEVVVATTRPETILGDTAVAVHPEDERYKSFIGQKVKLPFTDREIPIIADEYVDSAFGSGVVKITPAHDFNDYEVGKRHDLPFISILNRDGTLNENAFAYKGLKAQEARKRIVEDLKSQELLLKEEVHVHSVGHCSRSGVVVEPMLSEQWFAKMDSFARPARAVVESGTVTFEPESWTKVYLHWMNNIKDWCISRQLWWGHRIPAWYCNGCQNIIVAEQDPSKCDKCDSKDIRQDDDVLDTWFSSALWPFSTMGWPKETETLKTFYPTDVLVTGHDIIFFWVARMMMMGLEFCGDVPFRKVYIHGLIRDSEGRKMSKSLGNALEPVELIEEYGADSLRFTLLAQVASGKDLKFSVPRLEGYRNFMNKIWNASRFALSVLKDLNWTEQGIKEMPNKKYLSDADFWIVYKMGLCMDQVDAHLKDLRFSDAANTLYDFVWHQFCDWYLELIKPVVYGDKAEEKRATQLVLAQTLNRIMRLLHPFTPFITEELYGKLPSSGEACIVDTYPTTKNDREWLDLGQKSNAEELDLVLAVISSIRNIRGENRIKPADKVKVRISPHDANSQKIVQANKSFIMNLAKVESCEIAQEGSLSKCALTPIQVHGFKLDAIVYLEGVVDLGEEKKRIQKTIEKFQKEMSGLSARLGNENFVKNAPEDVVTQGREQLGILEEKIKSLQDSLVRLQ